MVLRRWLAAAALVTMFSLSGASAALAETPPADATSHGEAGSHGDAATDGEHHSPGPDVSAIVRHLLNLGLLIALLVWALRTPLSDFLRRRQFEVKDQLDASAEARTEAEARYQEIEARLGNFQGELDRLMADVKEDADIERRSIEQRAELAATQLESAARRTVEEELRRAQRSLRDEAVELAIGMAEDNLKSQVGDNDQKRLTDRYFDGVQAATRP